MSAIASPLVRLSAVGLALVWSLPPHTSGGEGDWPQWRGPNRDGHAAPQSLLQHWPSAGPPLLWEFEQAGRGYASVAVAGGRAYTLGARNGSCFAICLDVDTGRLVWETEISRASTDDDYLHGWGGGPRGTPTVDGDRLFALSDIGVLAALDRDGGSILWTTDLVADHGGSIPKWGYSESPLVDGDRVIVTPGESGFMIGLDRGDGHVVWRSRSFDEPAQYASIVRGSVGERPFYVTAAGSGLVAFDTESGELLFHDETTGNRTAVIPTPLVAGDRVYHTSGYGAGNTLLRLRADGPGLRAESVYHHHGKTMVNHHGGVVLVDDTIYGFSTADGGVWMAQDFQTGQVLWTEKIRPNSSGSIAYADGRLVCYNDRDGSLILVEPDRQGWCPRGEVRLPRQTLLSRDRGAIWTHPVIAAGKLFVRDQDLVFAYDIRAE